MHRAHTSSSGSLPVSGASVLLQPDSATFYFICSSRVSCTPNVGLELATPRASRTGTILSMRKRTCSISLHKHLSLASPNLLATRNETSLSKAAVTEVVSQVSISDVTTHFQDQCLL